MKQYEVMYNNINLYDYEMSKKEDAIISKLFRKLIAICRKNDVPRSILRLSTNEYLYKYINSVGYVALSGDRGIYELMRGFPTLQREEAMYLLLAAELHLCGFEYEVQNRKTLMNSWNYCTEYDFRIAAFEYTIKNLSTILDYYPERLVNEYTDLMNIHFDHKHWYYDRDAMEFREND